MLLIGLTGSIATGKSTVSSLLAAPPYGLPIIDADKLARQVVEPGTPAYRKIVAHFGPTTPDLLLTAAGGGGAGAVGAGTSAAPLNRAALGRRVFGDDPARRRDRAVLNSIVHPAVRAAMYRRLARCYLTGCWAVVLDVPLLFESRLDTLCGCILVVAVRDPAVQMARLRARDPHLSADDAANRVRSQGDVRDKARRCEARGRRRRNPGDAGRASSPASSSPAPETAASADLADSASSTSSARAASKDTSPSTPLNSSGIVLWNDSDRQDLARQLEAAMACIRAASPPWWHNALLVCPPLGLAVAAWTYWQNVQINRRWEADEKRLRALL